MKVFLKFSLWIGGLIIFAATLLVLIGPRIYGWMIMPDHEFGSKPFPAPPDYTREVAGQLGQMWTARQRDCRMG